MTKEQLRALCLAATPGPWIPAGPSFGEKLPVYYNCVCVDDDTDDSPDVCGDMEHADAEYIAAMDPTTTLALLDENERLRTAARAVVDRWDTPSWKDVPATANYINKLRMELSK